MKNIFRITCTVVLAIIFFAAYSSSVSAVDWQIKDTAKKCTFSADVVDTTYDFGKLKRVFVVPVNSIEGDLLPPDKSYIKKMGCKLTDEASADAVLEITIKDWKMEFARHVPEEIVYEAYEHYEGWKEVKPPFHHPPPKHRDDKHKHEHKHRPPPPRREWTESSSYFPGARRVVKPYSSFHSRKITSSTPFEGSKKVVYPAHDIYRSEVTALFEVRDLKTGKVIMNRTGIVSDFSRTDYRVNLYNGLCYAFCKNFKKTIKQAKKLAKELHDFQDLNKKSKR